MKITDADWERFAAKFDGLQWFDVIEVENEFRHEVRTFVMNADFEAYYHKMSLPPLERIFLDAIKMFVLQAADGRWYQTHA